ncbi:MAG: DUF4167 domain-containing protein [Cohaesibacteraceae bacterium]|nr:DUF4167 domain-containing protein [Cohaesibacteraceae bacterium]
MRQGQQNKRMRGRGRKVQNPLTRSFESNGPDVKVRGTASTIAEKYVSLARDAHVSGDRVMAENCFQHAEHYFRIVAAAQVQNTNRERESVNRPGVRDNRDNNRENVSDVNAEQPVVTMPEDNVSGETPESISPGAVDNSPAADAIVSVDSVDSVDEQSLQSETPEKQAIPVPVAEETEAVEQADKPAPKKRRRVARPRTRKPAVKTKTGDEASKESSAPEAGNDDVPVAQSASGEE